MATTYILRCFDNRYYIGSTKNIDSRLKDHSRGKCKFTKSRLPVFLIYREDFSTYSEARKRELEIKRLKSRKAIEKLIQ